MKNAHSSHNFFLCFSSIENDAIKCKSAKVFHLLFRFYFVFGNIERKKQAIDGERNDFVYRLLFLYYDYCFSSHFFCPKNIISVAHHK